VWRQVRGLIVPIDTYALTASAAVDPDGDGPHYGKAPPHKYPWLTLMSISYSDLTHRFYFVMNQILFNIVLQSKKDAILATNPLIPHN